MNIQWRYRHKTQTQHTVDADFLNLIHFLSSLLEDEEIRTLPLLLRAHAIKLRALQKYSFSLSRGFCGDSRKLGCGKTIRYFFFTYLVPNLEIPSFFSYRKLEKENICWTQDTRVTVKIKVDAVEFSQSPSLVICDC
jgi:hypothetical protein